MNDKQANALATKLAYELREREQCRDQMESVLTVHVLSWAFKTSSMKATSSFIVYLRKPMSMEEIKYRMWKGFKQ